MNYLGTMVCVLTVLVNVAALIVFHTWYINGIGAAICIGLTVMTFTTERETARLRRKTKDYNDSF